MYYPLSQIKTNLYTGGNEYALKSNPRTPYIGYYYKTSIGQSFTGKTPPRWRKLSFNPTPR